MKCPNCGKSLWLLRDFCVFCKTKLAAPPRPRSVTVISWLGIVLGVGQAYFLWLAAGSEVMANARAQHPIMSYLSYAYPAVRIICGIAMLRGVNWARWTFVVVLGYAQVNGLISGALNFSRVQLTGPLLFAIFVYYLFRPAAKAFFVGDVSVAQKLPDGQGKCTECGQIFATKDMIRHGTSHICAACKPRFMQKLSEGV